MLPFGRRFGQRIWAVEATNTGYRTPCDATKRPSANPTDARALAEEHRFAGSNPSPDTAVGAD
jgi:hypothetical protein